jgi:hypothetical protein
MTPAMANSWGPSGQRPVPGSVVWARVIGQKCAGVFSTSEMAEFDAYLAQAAAEMAADPKEAGFDFPKFVSALSADYAQDYPSRCDADATEARDILQGVKKVMASGKPLFWS